MITFFTKDYGKIRAVAQGARRSRKRGFGILQSFAQVQVQIVKTKRSPIPRIETADLLHAFYGLAADPVALGYGGYLLEVVDGFSQEYQAHRKVYDLLAASLDRLNRGQKGERLLRLFELLVADGFGLRPNLESCTGCGKPIGDSDALFSPILGGAVCQACRANHPHLTPLSAGTRQVLSRAVTTAQSRLDDLPISAKNLSEMRRFMPQFIEIQLGRQPKSVRYLRSILNLS